MIVNEESLGFRLLLHILYKSITKKMCFVLSDISYKTQGQSIYGQV